jgi:hypothetical protein
MKNNFKEFGEKKIKEIKLWAWAAAVLPIVSLAGLFFIWVFGTEKLFNTSMIIGATVMFTVAVIWWWWALHSIYSLLILWQQTQYTVSEVRLDVKEIRSSIKDFFFSRDK